MPSNPLPPEKRAEVEDLAHAIREAVDAEISERAANLATTDDAPLFGDNEFKLRAVPTWQRGPVPLRSRGGADATEPDPRLGAGRHSGRSGR